MHFLIMFYIDIYDTCKLNWIHIKYIERDNRTIRNIGYSRRYIYIIFVLQKNSRDTYGDTA